MKHVLKFFLILIFFWVFVPGVQAASLLSIQDLDPASFIEKPGGAYATFAGKFGGEVNQNDLKNTETVGVAGCAEGSLIYRFTLYIYSKDKKSVIKGESHILTDEMRDLLGSLTKGDSFEFKDIKAELPSGGTVDVVGRVFKVV